MHWRGGLLPSGVDESEQLLVCILQFYEKAAENVKENVGMEVQTDHLIREAYRNALEHVRAVAVQL